MNRYFYNPVVSKTEDGKYCVDIYKTKHKKPIFVSSTVHTDYKTVLINARQAVDILNKYEKEKCCGGLFRKKPF